MRAVVVTDLKVYIAKTKPFYMQILGFIHEI